MTLCCVEGCKSNSRKKEPGISFHRLPRHPVTRKKWIEKIYRRNWNPGPNTYVCSLHFEQSSINHTLEVARVKENHFPTIFPVVLRDKCMKPRAIPSTSRISTDKGDAQPSLVTDMPPAMPSTSGILTNKSHDQPPSVADTPPAMPSTSGILTNKIHDQPSSAADTAYTTRCNIPFCINGFKTSGKSHGISLFKFPKDPNTLKESVKALGINNWKANSNKEESSYETEQGRKVLHPDALPIKYQGQGRFFAKTMKCYVPSCTSDFKTGGKSHGISLFKFPKDPTTRKEWVKALGINNWEAKSNYTICSEHFKEESLYETKYGQKTLHPDALPVKNVDLDAPAALMICRICLTVGSNMQQISKFSEMFNNVTGLLAADSESSNLPQQLCWECAARLKSAASLRQKALSSDAILRDLLKPDTYIRIRDIKTINRKSNGLKTSLVQKLIDSDHYDVNIQDTFVATDHIETEYDLEEGIPELLENDAGNEVIKDIKSVKSNTRPGALPTLENGNEESNTKYLRLHNNDEENVKFVILQNNDKESDVQYVIFQNGEEENDLKYMMLQNDNFDIQSEELTIQSNNEATEENEMSDEDMLEEYLHSDDTEIVGESDIPKESSTIIHEENLKELDIGVQNVIKARRKKTVTRVLKNPAEMDNSRAVSGQTQINNEDISVLENLFEITDLTFEQQREEIIKRQEHESYKNAPYKCTVCFMGFVKDFVFDRHALKHTDTYGKFECTICKIRQMNKRKLSRHLVISHTREYKCLKCDFVTRHGGSARSHVSYHEGKRFRCKQCPLVFDKRSTYLGHVRLKHVHSFVCEYCGYTFVSQRGVINHKNLLHKLEKNVECKGPYCKECDITFLSKVAHSKHLRLSSKHLLDESDPSRMTNQLSYVQNTQRTYTPERRYHVSKQSGVTCEQCGEKSRTYYKYVRHFLRQHPGLDRTQHPRSTPYICEQCGKIFASANYLLSHQWVHTGKKMYQCDHCDKSFSQKPSLIHHLASVKEQGRPRHQCFECGKVFTFESNLKRHEMVHRGLKPLECDSCSKTFNSKDCLYSHKRHVHNKVPWPRKEKRRDVKKI